MRYNFLGLDFKKLILIRIYFAFKLDTQMRHNLPGAHFNFSTQPPFVRSNRRRTLRIV